MKRIVIISSKASNRIIDSLLGLGFEIIKTVECKEVYDAIKYHPDIVMTKVNEDTLVVNPNYYEYYFDKLKKHNINLVRGDSQLEDKYPENIAYNIAIDSKYAIHNFKYSDKNVLKYLENESYKFINVKQGYTKCSVITLGDKGIITSDKDICLKAQKEGLEALHIDHGQVVLDGFDYGFIGGSSGYYDDELYLTGVLDNHSSKFEIINFLEKKNIKINYLSDYDIVDLGSLIFL